MDINLGDSSNLKAQIIHRPNGSKSRHVIGMYNSFRVSLWRQQGDAKTTCCETAA